MSCKNLCTNGKDTYHEYNMKHSGGCIECGEMAVKQDKRTGGLASASMMIAEQKFQNPIIPSQCYIIKSDTGEDIVVIDNRESKTIEFYYLSKVEFQDVVKLIK